MNPPTIKTILTEEGFVVDAETNGVIGWKCLRCSTTAIYDEETQTNVELLASAVSADMDIHRNCP